MRRFAVPIAGAAIVGSLAFLLLGVTVVRPWSGPNTSWRTHLNLGDQPAPGFTRTTRAYAGETGSYPRLTGTSNANVETGDPAVLPLSRSARAAGEVPSPGAGEFAEHGCVLCHGLDALGAHVGPDLSEKTKSEIRKAVRKGPGGMPKFGESDLSDKHLALIVEYIRSLQAPAFQSGNGK